LALFLLSAITHDDISLVSLALAFAALAAFAGSNWQVTGLCVLGLGIVLNLGAVVLNNGMPVRPRALVQSHATTAQHVGSFHLRDPRHLEADDDHYAWLGEIVPVPVVHQALSFGDLLVLVGLTDAARDLARRRARLPEVDEDDEDDGPDPDADAATAQVEAPTTQASADQDCGDAPSGDAESGSQCSAKPETTAADVMEFWKDAALAPSPAHLAARHDR
jgi:hypothetical protein